MNDPPDLTKWQAASHPELVSSKPEDLFAPEFAQRYRRLHEQLRQLISQAHNTIYVLEQIANFPFQHVYAPSGMVFWHLVATNFRDTACSILHTLVNDNDKDVLSLDGFKAKIIQAHWLDEGKKELLVATLRDRRFDYTMKDIAERIGKIRTHRIAHWLVDYQEGERKELLAGVTLEELRSLFDAAHSLFGAISFGSSFATLAGDQMPSTVGGKPKRSCLDEVLDAILRDSAFVNQPERDGAYWADIRQHKSPQELDEMNKCRTRLELPEA